MARIEELIFIEARSLGEKLKATKGVVATAESCTAGLISGAITDVANSSAWFDRGFVTYTNRSKMEMLGVKEETLEQFGAVSEETVKEMSLGVLKNSQANYSIAVSGIAGPTGATPDKPLGTVWFAFAHDDKVIYTLKMVFSGDRKEVRNQAVYTALSELNRLLG